MRTKCAISYSASEIALLRSLKNVQLIENTCPEPHWHSAQSRIKWSAKTHRDSTQSRIVRNLGSPHYRKNSSEYWTLLRTFLDCGVGDSTWRICDISGKLRPLNYRVHCMRWFILILSIVCQMISILAYFFQISVYSEIMLRDERWKLDVWLLKMSNNDNP